VFKAALKTSSYKEYFMDMFEGDFGHCTRKGNKLLAENIAEVLIKEYFSKNRYYNSYIVQKGAANVN
jgi:hypothetical protein